MNKLERLADTVKILSVQSWVTFGHVGNAAALFPLQRLGAEVLALHTVQFSNHTGYGSWTGQTFTGATVADLIEGVDARGALTGLDAVLSGYLGDETIGDAILAGVARTRVASPGALYCCDPVIGDVGRGVFVRPGIPELLAGRAVPAADILTPNQFELEHLTGAACHGVVDAVGAATRLRASMRAGGPRLVLVTSLSAGIEASEIAMLLVHDGGAVLLRTPRLPVAANGAGDLTAAVMLFHVLREGPGGAVRALERAASSVWGILRATAEADDAELRIVAAQDELVRPGRMFRAEPLPVS
ncbi:pyridoxal kinase PdxY [Rhizosaccharibacter radicis]|uniref:pyridoxal kinase n=1 Tax=Rhizosaccharibacter radicis TaxID=2782605 RepID=A0ABT1VZ33_9PROT|nr:pyridoxal kinase PdxY [Acetobacteraceae bacterium KSS12]